MTKIDSKSTKISFYKERLIIRLKEIKQTIELDKRFSYNFDYNSPLFTDQEKNELSLNQNIFSRNLKLKELIKLKVNGSYNCTDLNFWIIKDWGKLNFKRNDKNIKKIETYSKELLSKRLTKTNFDTISSLSKISSFVDPDNYVIYDSRVIYSINWLILTTSSVSDLKFFPMPPPRNKKLSNIDLNTIIRLKNKSMTNAELFYNHKVAYFKFCELIKSLSKIVFDDKTIKPYYLEMLLFTIADNEIYNELKNWASIEIENHPSK